MSTKKMSRFCNSILVFIFTTGLVQKVSAYSSFIGLIPNGNNVPHPCDGSVNWNGVGHRLHQGGGPKNDFGQDFHDVSRNKWSMELCKMDSDGDGKTNGEELGDPNCTWTPGQVPTVTDRSKISHPGVCEPVDSARCKLRVSFLLEDNYCRVKFNRSVNAWCPAITAPNVRKMVLRYDQIVVPENETSYMCQEFQLPNDQDYQIIAWEPYISNYELMHHMVWYACDRPNEIQQLQAMPDKYKKPVVCDMAPECKSYAMVWAFGVPPRCYDERSGVPFGLNYYNKTIIQIHYNNPNHMKGRVDSSGIIIYYTPKERQYDVGTYIVGQMDIRIPPKSESHTVSGGLTGKCSKKVLARHESYNFTSMLLHLHQIGSYGRVTLTKNKTNEVIDIVNKELTYDNPELVTWGVDNQLSMEPGDSLEVECRYNASKRTEWTLFGEETNDEMCFAIFELYPPVTQYISSGAIDIGPFDSCSMGANDTIEGCTRSKLHKALKQMKNETGKELETECFCHNSTYPIPQCSRQCYDFLEQSGLLEMPACFRGSVFHVSGIRTDWATSYNLMSHIERCLTHSKENRPSDKAQCHHHAHSESVKFEGDDDSKDNKPNSANQQMSILFTLIMIFSFSLN